MYDLWDDHGVLLSGFGRTLPPELKGAPSSEVMRFLLPDYTCPDINLVQDFLLSALAPPEVLLALENVRGDNSNLRAVAKAAIRKLKENENAENR